MSDSEKQSVYEKFTPQRKELVDAILQNLEKGYKEWKQGWAANGKLDSAVRHRRMKKYPRLEDTSKARVP